MDLFKGQELFKADETKVSADEVLKDKDFVLLYFSAHWCPPCRAFTPKLKEFYNEVKDKKVEIIFVSGDQDPKAMYDYMKESHGDWFAVEHESKLSDKLNEKFQVSGIPTLVVLRGDGTVVTKGGRGDVGNHGPDALKVWNTSVMDILKDQKFKKLDGTEVSTETLTSTKSLIGFYFSAHWCPPCRNFTPKLKEFYQTAKNEGLEIIFLSADRDEESMKSYMKESHGDWLSIEYGSELAKNLPSKFGVSGIPCLIILKPDGSIVTEDGVEDVTEKGNDAIKQWKN